MEISVDITEVMTELRDNGAFRKALLEVVRKKGGGKEVNKVHITFQDFAKRASKEFSLPRTVEYAELAKAHIDIDRLRASFVDTMWAF